jgi:histidine triad (HIT) family protein
MSRKPRVLFLHGYGESSLMSGMSTDALTKALSAANVEFLPVPDGFHKLKNKLDFEPIVDKEYRAMCQSGDLEAFSWYSFIDPKKVTRGGHRSPPYEDFNYRTDPAEMKEAAKRMCAYIDKQGGVDGLFGFSQGGELAYLVAENLEHLKTRDKLKFIATFGSEDTFLQRGMPPETTLPPTLRFFICYGEHDLDAKHDSQTAQAHLEGAGAPMVVARMVKGLDHHMPKEGDAAYKTCVELFADARAGKPVPEEFKPKAHMAAPPPSPPPTVLRVSKASADAKLGVVLASKGGKLVASTVKEGSATEAAGLKTGDVIVAINGTPAPSKPVDATALLKAAGAGTIELTLERAAATEAPAPPADVTDVDTRTLFTKIIDGDIPSSKVAGGDKWYAFLDINPRRPGHTLVVPKEEKQRITDLSPASRAALLDGVAEVERKLTAKFKTTDFFVCVHDGPAAGQEVPHVHFHVIPREKGDGAKDMLAVFPNSPPPGSRDPDFGGLAALSKELVAL